MASARLPASLHVRLPVPLVTRAAKTLPANGIVGNGLSVQSPMVTEIIGAFPCDLDWPERLLRLEREIFNFDSSVY